MAVLNYSTTISAGKTLGEIHQLLAGYGVQAITTEYTPNRVPSAITFTIPTRFGDRRFRLPANTEGVFQRLDQAYSRRQIPLRFVTREQAARVGWRILKDWIEAQCAIIDAGMAATEEVFFPYMLLPSGETVYERAVDVGMKLLPEHT